MKRRERKEEEKKSKKAEEKGYNPGKQQEEGYSVAT